MSYPAAPTLLFACPPAAVPQDKGIYTIRSWAMETCGSGGNHTHPYMSAPSCNDGAEPVMQDVETGFNKHWIFELVPGRNSTYYIKNFRCNKYLGVQGCNGDAKIRLSATAGPNEQFQLIPTVRSTAQEGEHTFTAVARAGACDEWITTHQCNETTVDLQKFQKYIAAGHSAGNSQGFWVTYT